MAESALNPPKTVYFYHFECIFPSFSFRLWVCGRIFIETFKKITNNFNYSDIKSARQQFSVIFMVFIFSKASWKKIWSNKWEKWFLFMPCFCHYLHAVSAAIFFLSVTFFAWCLSLVVFLISVHLSIALFYYRSNAFVLLSL